VKSDPAKFGLSGIGQIAVNVRDIKKATAFYQGTLGIMLSDSTAQSSLTPQDTLIINAV
jgi:catechol 2,3-dioxygenase-like lactoylglutathione lyase family enzyme